MHADPIYSQDMVVIYLGEFAKSDFMIDIAGTTDSFLLVYA